MNNYPFGQELYGKSVFTISYFEANDCDGRDQVMPEMSLLSIMPTTKIALPLEKSSSPDKPPLSYLT
jgi:hypothetical protein